MVCCAIQLPAAVRLTLTLLRFVDSFDGVKFGNTNRLKQDWIFLIRT
jgi:hypothetical protein